MTTLSEKIHLLMLERSLSQKDLSFQTKIDRSTITKIINGSTNSPKIDTLLRLSKFFNVDISYLLENTPEESFKGEPISLNLKKLMIFNDINAAYIHRVTNIPESVISDILNEVTLNPNIKTLQLLSSLFNVSIPELLGKTMFKLSERNKIKEYITLPLLKFNMIEDWIKNKSEPYKYIKIDPCIFGENIFAILIEDDKLFPEFRPNEIIVFNPNITPKQNAIFIGKFSSICIYEIIKELSDNMVVLREIGTDEIYKVQNSDYTNYGILVKRMLNN